MQCLYVCMQVCIFLYCLHVYMYIRMYFKLQRYRMPFVELSKQGFAECVVSMVVVWCSQIHMPRMTLQTLHSTAFRLQTLHFTLQTPHLTLGTKRPTLHFTFSILNTTSENHTLQTLQSTPCTLHPPVATLRTPDANSTFHMPTSALYTLQNHTHREKVQDGARFQTSMGK